MMKWLFIPFYVCSTYVISLSTDSVTGSGRCTSTITRSKSQRVRVGANAGFSSTRVWPAWPLASNIPVQCDSRIAYAPEIEKRSTKQLSFLEWLRTSNIKVIALQYDRLKLLQRSKLSRSTKRRESKFKPPRRSVNSVTRGSCLMFLPPANVCWNVAICSRRSEF